MTLSVKEAAERLGVGVSRIRILIKDGRLPAAKPGGRDWIIQEKHLKLVANRPTGRPRLKKK